LYRQTNESNEENNLIALSNTCNQPGATLVVTEPKVQNNIACRFEKFISMVDTGVSSQSDVSSSHDTLQEVYDNVKQPEMDRAYTELKKER